MKFGFFDVELYLPVFIINNRIVKFISFQKLYLLF